MNAASSGAASSRRWRWHHFIWVLLALAAIVLLRKGESRYEDRDAPILQRYAANEEARGRNFTVRIKRIKVAHAYLLKGDYGKPDYALHTPGSGSRCWPRLRLRKDRVRCRRASSRAMVLPTTALLPTGRV